MRWRGLLLILMATFWLGAGAARQDPVSRLLATPSSEFAAGLPGDPFGGWLKEQLPAGALPVFRSGPCGAAQDDCVTVEVDLVSRARTLHLAYASDPPRFLGGTVTSPDSQQQLSLGSLAELSEQLAMVMRPAPLDCPEGTRNMLRESYAGLHEWCKDEYGRRHGPARSWYSAGRYLMWRGQYERDERVGSWVECDRFERCRTRAYP